ncbi:MAG TPA: hypothetical protein VFO58_15255 [Vicinamibacterales bacterium]|nr:hypothetical protein [Vicinamibacterales bacterium]
MAGVTLALFSTEWQLLSAGGLEASVGLLALFHGAVLAVLLFRERSRALLSARLRAAAAFVMEAPRIIEPRSSRVFVVACLGTVVCVLAARATLFLPESADPYHLVKVWTLNSTGSLRAVPSADWKINAMGYLYELALLDVTLGSTVLQLWSGVQGPMLFLGYVMAIVWALKRATRSVPAYALLLPCLAPVVFHQGILIKNDLFAALLLIPALLLLFEFRADEASGGALSIGFLAGLAASVKTSSAPALVAVALFLPWRPLPLAARTRAAAGAGFVLGLLGGGLAFVVVQNVSVYGSPTGLLAGTGNATESIPAAAVSLGRFVMSWFDFGLVTRQIWPGRGGWGGAFGPAFLWALAVLVIRARQREPRRALGIVLSCLVPFGLVYPDADLAHRLAIAPAVFAILAAIGIEATRGTLKGWTPVAAAGIVSVVLSGALLARSSWQYLRQAEYLRSTQLALTISDPATLASTEAWRLRQANAALSGASHVCTMTQENMQGLWGHSFEPVAAIGRRAGRDVLDWRADALDRCDAILLGPNGYDLPPPAVASTLRSCIGADVPVTGASVDIRAVRCGR